MIKISQDLQFHLSNKNISYLFRVSPEGILEHLHFGKKVSADALGAGPRRMFRCTTLEFQGVENYNLSDTPQEYPLFGTSDTRYPALHVVNSDGNSSNVLRYHSHHLLTEKPELRGLPAARGGEGASETLIIDLVDEISHLRAQLLYTVYDEFDVIARSTVIHNDGEKMVELHNALSSSLDLPADNYDILHLRGTWSREFNQQRMAVAGGRFVIESASGTSGNAHNPFVAILSKDCNEQSGDVYATSLVYSGNFAISVEKGEFDAVRVTAGINPFNFKWQLAAGESFYTPESVQVFSANGLDAMSQTWHGFIKEHISPPQHCDLVRPTYLNSWEAAYFDINAAKVLELADKAKELGIEMLVVDDGWFAGRDDDTTSLGDWFSDKTKFPDGIQAVAKKVKQKGLKFGLWFEPEMVNADSDLFRAHPDWIIHVPNRVPSTGRQQLTLDLSRTEVVDYLFERIDSLLSCGDIDYLKWDMNRIMSEVGSATLAPTKQLETAHRVMLGVYQLVGRIVSKYPNVLFENCAAGGNRFDLGMLSYMAQGWVSDMAEPIGRLPIINGASLLYPPSVLASYISPVPSHQNGRIVSLKTRAEVGFFCAARGLSLNLQDIAQDAEELKAVIAFYKSTAKDVLQGSFHRLINTANEVCWQLNSLDGGTVYLGYVHILSAANLPYRRTRLIGLDEQSVYVADVQGADQPPLRYAGDSLMHMGLDLPYVHALQQAEDEQYMPNGDFSSTLLVLRKSR